MKKRILMLASLIGSAVLSQAALTTADRWFDEYTTVLANPQKADYAYVAPDVVRSGGYYGGWYGYGYHDDQNRTTYAPNMWSNTGNAGSRRFFYFDSGEIGDYCVFLDSNGDIVKNGWQIANWSGTPAIESVRWLGLEGFMTNAAWSPYDTADDYGLPAFTHPDGTTITSNLYSVLSRKYLDGTVNMDYITNTDVSDEIATNSGLSEISQKIDGAWNTVTLYHIDNANPQMAEYRVAEAQKLMEDILPDGVHIDNMGANNLWWPRSSAFGDWSVYRFREYLTNRFTSVELTALGVTNLATFDIVAHINAGPDIDEDAWTEDTLWNEYKIYKAQTGIEYQQTLYDGLRNKADELELDFAVTGNLLPIWPGAALNKGLFDIDNFEWNSAPAYPEFSEMSLPPNGRSAAYLTRLGANISKTPYCWINLYVQTADADKPELHKIMACDTLANKGILDYAFEYLGKTFAGTDDSALFINNWIESMASHGLSDREYVADVGLLFNPWCDVAESTVHSMQHDRFIEEYSGWCDYLTETHRQWDVVLSEDMDAELLAKYPILVLPSITVLNDQQVAWLKDYANNGGRLVISGQTGRRFGTAGSLLPRPTNAFDGFSAPDFHSTSNYPGRDYRLNDRDTAAASEMGALLNFSGFTPSISVDSAITAGVNLNRQTIGGKTRLSIDINNYGGYVATDDTVVPAGSAWITVQLPDELTSLGLSVSCIYAGMTDPLTPEVLPASQVVHLAGTGEMQILVNSTEYYQTVLIEQGTVDPYVADSSTLHLWHLDGTNNPLQDAAGSLNLFNWGDEGSSGVNSVSGLNAAYESSKTTNSCLQSNGDISWANELMGPDGAFTWEMVLRPDSAADDNLGGAATEFQMLMQHSKNDLHLKFNYLTNGNVHLALYNDVQGTVVNQLLNTGSLGINQYAANEWFHLAVTYDGNSAGKVYWTKLSDDSNSPANELVSFSMNDFELIDATLAFAGVANLVGKVFNGAIDEIHISSIARRADELLQITVDVSPAGIWRENYFGDSSNSGDGADMANPDSDSLVNLLEFAFGTNPTVSDASALTVDGGGGSFTPGTPIVDVAFAPFSVQARFIRLVDHANSGITYTAQFSHDLSTWDDLVGSAAVRISGTSEAGGYEAVELSYPELIDGKKARFFRMQINETASGVTQP